MLLPMVTAAAESSTATESIIIEGSVGAHSPIQNTINKQDPAVSGRDDEDLRRSNGRYDRGEGESRSESGGALAQELGFTKAAVAQFFKILGEQNVLEEKIPTRLVEVATHFAQTRDELAVLEPDDPHAADLARAAKTALDAGRLAEADGLLDQAKEAELAAFRQAREFQQQAQKAADRHALNAAKLIAGRGNIALTQLRYVNAADRFKEAAILVPAGHQDVTANYLSSEAEALYRQGDEKGDNAALKQSIEIWSLVLAQRPRERVPLDWAATQNNLGNAL